jgi:hypothetical protein
LTKSKTKRPQASFAKSQDRLAALAGAAREEIAWRSEVRDEDPSTHQNAIADGRDLLVHYGAAVVFSTSDRAFQGSPMASKPPDAFLSYTRSDDRHDGGAITEFRNRLASAVRAVTGEPFEIFQDADDIDVGERWSDKLDEMLAEARFFIPILTPSYFNSAACRNELEKFLKAEETAGRRDLILPIYYIRCPVLEARSFGKPTIWRPPSISASGGSGGVFGTIRSETEKCA